MQPQPIPESLADQWARTHGELLSVSDASRALGVARSTLYKYIDEGNVARTPDGKVVTRSLAAYINTISTATGKRGSRINRSRRGAHLVR